MGADYILYIGRTLIKPLIAHQAESPAPAAAVRHFANGRQAWAALYTEAPALVIINAASTRTSGSRLCQSARRLWPNVPVLVLAMSDDKVPQADCVMQMPVSPSAITQFVNAALAHHPAGPPDQLVSAGPFTLDTVQRILSIRTGASAEDHILRPKEANLLHFFLQHTGEVIDRKTLMAAVWQTDYLGDTRTLNVHIRALRIYLETDPSRPRFLHTVRGEGYRLTVAPQGGD